jgi:hypothetical protein
MGFRSVDPRKGVMSLEDISKENLKVLKGMKNFSRLKNSRNQKDASFKKLLTTQTS